LYYIEGGDSMPIRKFTTDRVYTGYMKVNSCGQQWLGGRDYTTIREAGRSDYSVYYISQGKCSYQWQGRNYWVTEGNLLLYFPGVRQQYAFQKSDNAVMLWSHFSGTACDLLSPLKSDTPVVVKIRDQKQFLHIFERMITAQYNKITQGDLLCDSYMPVLIALMLQHSNTTELQKAGRGNEQIEKVLSKMHVDFNKPIDIKAYAEMCHLSEDRFIRMFKSQMGMPPYRYQLKIRIQRAVEMLENTNISIGACAEAVGFHDNAYFCRIFKKFTGHPPSFYKG